MAPTTLVLVMLLAVVLSSMLTRMVPMMLPLPLVQIGLGAIISGTTNLRIVLTPDVFFLLFLPPLLFLDGWRIPRQGLLQDKWVIMNLALGLVVFTVLGAGFAIHWLIPAIPLPVAFALAAVLSPTDAVAVSAIAARGPFPSRLLRILEGEALLNDASGLVCFRFALGAALTGAFSLAAASLTFLWVSIGGLGIGIVVTLAIGQAKWWVARRFGEDTGNQILISFLIPFAAYLLAEYVGCSGILAAAAAGVTMNFIESKGRVTAQTRLRRQAVWDMAQTALNGIIFVLLGEQLPGIVAGATWTVDETGHSHRLWLLFYILAITAALGLLRFAWVWASLQFMRFRHARDAERRPKADWHVVAIVALSGVRGAVTLAGVLTLPYTLPNGEPFPARDLSICLAAGVIIVSLLLAGFLVQPLLRRTKMPPVPSHEEEEARARIAAATEAIRAVEQAQHDLSRGRSDADLYAEAAARVMELYRHRVEGLSQTGDSAARAVQSGDLDRTMRIAGLRAERETIIRLERIHSIDEETMRKLVREVDLVDAVLRDRAAGRIWA